MEFKEYALIDCLSELIDYRGKTPKKLGGDWSKDGKYRAISAKNIKNNELVNEQSIKKVDDEIYKKWMKKEINKGDILLTSEAPLGETYYWDSEEKIVLSQRVYGLRANTEILTSKYLYAYMQSKEFLHELTSRESGTTVTGIRQSELGKVKIKVPVKSIQSYIGRTIYDLNKKIQLNKDIIRNLQLISQVFFKQWFIDFEFPNEEGKPYKSSGGEMVKSELGGIPENWNVSSISELCTLNKGNYSKKDEWDFVNYLDTSNITKNSINNIQFIDTKFEKVPSRAKRKLEKNDIVYSTVRPDQHHFGLIKEPVINMLASTGFTVIRSNGSYPNDLIYLWITQDKITNHLQSVAEQSTSAYPSIKSADLGALKIIVPPKKELDKLNNIISRNHNLIWNYQLENKIISQIRETLLPKLFSGEIEIPEEKEV